TAARGDRSWPDVLLRGVALGSSPSALRVPIPALGFALAVPAERRAPARLVEALLGVVDVAVGVVAVAGADAELHAARAPAQDLQHAPVRQPALVEHGLTRALGGVARTHRGRDLLVAHPPLGHLPRAPGVRVRGASD